MDASAIISENENHLERLHDDLLRLILDRVHDAKSLCSCLAVSTRFNSLALHSSNLSLSVDRIHFNDSEDESDPPTSSKHNLLRSLFTLLISAPLRFLTRLANSRTDDSSSAVFYSPSQALKSFSGIQILKIQLPSHGELQLDNASNPLLKWKATFGAEIKTCVIVAANCVEHLIPGDDDVEERGRGSEVACRNNKEEQAATEGLEVRAEAPFSISNEDLKTRVVWTISCLIAASSRHHLLKRIVSEHPMLKAIEMVDERRQGTLTMDEAGVSELRIVASNSESSSSTSEGERSRIPALKMKMWHAAELELPGCKKVMKGATLLVIGDADVEDGMFEGGEEETMYGEAAREIRRKMKQSYSLEMDSF